jgi:hypothetical protein
MAFHLNAFLDACPVAFWPERGGLLHIRDDPLDAAEYRVYLSPGCDQLISQVPAFSFFNARHMSSEPFGGRVELSIRGLQLDG